MASMRLLASSAGQASVTSSERASSPGWRKSIRPITMRAIRAAMRRPGGGAGCGFGVEGLADDLSRFLDAPQAPSVVRDDQPPAHGNGARGKDTASFDQGQLRRAAADINVEQRRVVPARKRNRT